MGAVSSAICKAAQDGNEAEVRRLARGGLLFYPLDPNAGASVDELDRTSYGWSPIHYAVYGDHPGMIRTLAGLGADLNRKSAKGLLYGLQTPLMLAADKTQEKCLASLLECGANPDLGDQVGWTALHYAVRRAAPRLVHRLLAAGALPEAKSDTGTTPLRMAMENNTSGAVVLLAPLCRDETVISEFDERVEKLDVRWARYLLSTGRIPRDQLDVQRRKIQHKKEETRLLLRSCELAMAEVKVAVAEIRTGMPFYRRSVRTDLTDLMQAEKELQHLQLTCVTHGSNIRSLDALLDSVDTALRGNLDALREDLNTGGLVESIVSFFTSAFSGTEEESGLPPLPTIGGQRPAPSAVPVSAATAPAPPRPEAAAPPKRRASLDPTAPQVDEPASDEVCSICMSNPRNAALVPCGHMLCLSCAREIHARRQPCAVCRTKIDSVLKVYQ